MSRAIIEGVVTWPFSLRPFCGKTHYAAQ
jgi:hypothetical protein